MKYKTINLCMSLTFSLLTSTSQAQNIEYSKIKAIEHQLGDLMELTDTNEVKNKLEEVEQNYHTNPSELNKIRLGIIYHETALNFTFLSKSNYKGYAQKSYDILTELSKNEQIDQNFMPFIASYRASSVSLVGAETQKLSFLSQAFDLFSDAVKKYESVSYLPEFLRGSVAENLPWIFVFKKKAAKNDFQSIILKQEKNDSYANAKIMSFTYWAWANQHPSKKFRKQALFYLDKAIALDPNYKAGRKKAEELKMSIVK